MDKKIHDVYDNIKLDDITKKQMLDNITTGKERKSNRGIRVAVAALAVTLVAASGTAYAASKWMSAKEVAESFELSEVAEYFGKNPQEVQTARDGEYTFAYLGNVSKETTEVDELGALMEADKTYVVVAVEKDGGFCNGTWDDVVEGNVEERFSTSAFIKGYPIDEVNTFTLSDSGTGGTFYVYDGIFYLIEEYDMDLDIYADMDVYLGVFKLDGHDGYLFEMDEKTGEIKRSDVAGVGVLFNMNLDKSKADSKEAQRRLDEIHKEYLEDMEQTTEQATEPDIFDGLSDQEALELRYNLLKETIDTKCDLLVEHQEIEWIEDGEFKTGYHFKYNVGEYVVGGVTDEAYMGDLNRCIETRWLKSTDEVIFFEIYIENGKCYQDVYKYLGDTSDIYNFTEKSEKTKLMK